MKSVSAEDEESERRGGVGIPGITALSTGDDRVSSLHLEIYLIKLDLTNT